jgi:hypothetical protein
MAETIFTDDDPTNEDRAAAALAAIERVDKYHPYRYQDEGKWVIDHSSISDLVADLLHLAHQNGHAPAEIIETATLNYYMEIMEEREHEQPTEPRDNQLPG